MGHSVLLRHWARPLRHKLLGFPMPLEVLEDNQATIIIAKAGWSPKMRHVVRSHKVDLGSLGEEFEEGSGVTLQYVDTTEQSADIFTKDLEPAKWNRALSLLGVRPHFA